MLYDDDYSFFDHCFNCGRRAARYGGRENDAARLNDFDRRGCCDGRPACGKDPEKNRQNAADCGLELA